MAAYPCNFVYHPVQKTLSWDPVPEAEDYEIVYKLQGAVDWINLYSGGIATEAPFDHPDAIAVKGKAKTKGKWGAWSPEELVTVS